MLLANKFHVYFKSFFKGYKITFVITAAIKL